MSRNPAGLTFKKPASSAVSFDSHNSLELIKETRRTAGKIITQQVGQRKLNTRIRVLLDCRSSGSQQDPYVFMETKVCNSCTKGRHLSLW